MDKVIRKRLLPLSILLLITFNILTALNLNTIGVSAVEHPAIYIEPVTIMNPNLRPGDNFTVSIKTDYAGDDIQGYQFTLSYNASILNGVNVTNGDLIVGGTARFIAGKFNNTKGTLSLTGAFFFFIFEPAPLASGPGTLANVTFTVVDIGTSDITLGPETKLKGYTEGGYGDKYDIITVIFWNTDTWAGDGVTIVFNTTQTPVFPESEFVYVNGIFKRARVDYYIDYITGEITFYIAPGVGAEIKATYQYIEPDHKLQHGSFDNTPRPVASFTYSPEKPIVNETVTFNASASYHPDGEIVNYKWNFGDGTTKIYVKDLNLTVTTTHAYTMVGTYMINLTVTDTEGKTDTATTDVTVLLHDIAITSVTASPDTVKIGEPVSINVTVVNEGTEEEAFNITAYYDDIIIGTQSIAELDSGASQSLVFSWDTSDVGAGAYTIKALATTVTNETDTADNSFIDGSVTVEEAPPPGIPWNLYVAAAGAAAIIIAAVVIYFLRIRKPKTT